MEYVQSALSLIIARNLVLDVTRPLLKLTDGEGEEVLQSTVCVESYYDC